MQTVRFTLLLVFCFACLACSAPTTPVGELRVWSVLEFGAVGDNKTVDTDAVRRGIRAVSRAGGGTLVFPKVNAAGMPAVYLTGPFNLTSRLNLVVESGAVLVACADRGLYGAADRGFISAYGVHSSVLSGGGVIDGLGSSWWGSQPRHAILDEADLNFVSALTSSRDPPHLLFYDSCSDMTVEDLEFRNPPFWAIHPFNVSGLVIQRISVHSPINSPNTDCIDPDSCQGVTIKDSQLACGDDHISIKASCRNGTCIPSRDILVDNTTFLHGQGMTIGSMISGSVYNVTFQNRGVVRDIRFLNLRFESVAVLMSINMAFNHNGPAGNESMIPRIENVSMENISGWGVVSAVLNCLPESPCQGFRLQNVNLVYCQEYQCSHIHGKSSNCSHPAPCRELRN